MNGNSFCDWRLLPNPDNFNEVFDQLEQLLQDSHSWKWLVDEIFLNSPKKVFDYLRKYGTIEQNPSLPLENDEVIGRGTRFHHFLQNFNDQKIEKPTTIFRFILFIGFFLQTQKESDLPGHTSLQPKILEFEIFMIPLVVDYLGEFDLWWISSPDESHFPT